VVVITGASSGIGRETAVHMARQGAKLALIARGEGPLHAAAREVEEAGGKALAIPADVSSWSEVQEAARRALEHYGRIDTWINNASVYAVVPVEAMTVEEFNQVIQINLMGVVHGVKAVLPHFIEAGGGTIINVSSVLGVRGAPNVAAYATAKHGIKGFTESLRLELARSHPNINVVLLLPLGINTPLFDHSLARIGVKPRPNPPVYEPSVVAEALADVAVQPKRDVYIGPGRFFQWAEALAPAFVDRMMLTGDSMTRLMKTDQPEPTMNNLFGPASPDTYATTGFLGNEARGFSLSTRYLELHPNAWRAGLGAAGTALVALKRRSSRRNGANGNGAHED
jgi:NAD(P)-dependent dehydrogenase (short-subunit alcohol dehydrogenase family)